jgi:hypothetical protein
MKKLIIAIFTSLFASCAFTANYYQVYQTNNENGILTNDKIIFEDKSCSVAYNLWADGGDIGFSIYNKTESDLIVDLTKTFFVLNGVSYEYFQNRSFSKSSSSGTTLTTSNYPYYYYSNYNSSKSYSTSSSATYMEKPQLTIPPKTQVMVSEYHVAKTRYLNCDLSKYPTSKTIKTVQFDKSNSPFVFYNLISYKSKGDSTRMENRFYVSEITNYPEVKMFTKVDTSICGRKLNIPERIFKNVTPDKFYYKYTK